MSEGPGRGGKLSAAVRAVPLVLVLACAAVQVPLGIRSDLRHVHQAAPDWLYRAESPPNPEASAVRVLPRIAQRIPADARVVLVTSVLVQIQYEFYFLPRPFQMLLDFPAELIPVLVEHDAFHGWYAGWIRERLARRDQLFSPARFERALLEADYVVAFYFDELAVERPELVPRARIEGATLFAVRR